MKLEEMNEPIKIPPSKDCVIKMKARRRLRRCCKHILWIQRMGEAVTKSRSGPKMQAQDTSVTHHRWPGTVFRRGDNECLWRPERPGWRKSKPAAAQAKTAVAAAQSADTSDTDYEECPRCSEEVPTKWGTCNFCGAKLLGWTGC